MYILDKFLEKKHMLGIDKGNKEGGIMKDILPQGTFINGFIVSKQKKGEVLHHLKHFTQNHYRLIACGYPFEEVVTYTKITAEKEFIALVESLE